MRHIYFTTLFCLIFTLNSFSQVLMTGNHVPAADLGENAAPAEMTARDELAKHLRLVFGRFKTPHKYIYLGRSPQCIKHYGEELLAELAEEEFLIESDKSGHIYISGGRPRGTLYGVYWFLDRLLGIRWYTPDFEYIPELDVLDLGTLKIRQKPTFRQRTGSGNHLAYLYIGGRTDPQWSARNLLNDTRALVKRHYISPVYGGEFSWAPPYFSHGMIELIPSRIYFDKHPEWFALYNGKRIGRGVASDYCLSNPELLEETVKQIRIRLQQYPQSRLVSVQEGDGTVAACECENCQAMLKKYGGKESGMWIDFANRVGEELEEEFPDVTFVTFAYTRTQEPPVNIVARHNVGVQICAWGISRGIPYADPRNTYRGNAFIENIIEPWSKICTNILFWDYVYTFGDIFMQEPNPLINVENLRTFSKYTDLGVFAENTANDYSNGQPFRSWLMTRLFWNPFEIDGEEELNKFCRAYYGAGGKYVSQYWQNLRETNEKQGFCHFLAGGSIGQTPAEFESFETTLESYALLQKALQATENSPLENHRIKDVLSSVQYHILNNWRDWQKELEEKSFTRERIYTDLLAHAEKNYVMKGDHALIKFIKRIKNLYELYAINAKASVVYGTSYAAYAYDGDINTHYHSGTQGAWCQREFEEPVELSRIISVICGAGNVEATYSILGSMDGENWFPIVEERTQKNTGDGKRLYADDKLEKPIKAKIVRTRIRKIMLPDGRVNDVTLYEQFFNPTEMPRGLLKK